MPTLENFEALFKSNYTKLCRVADNIVRNKEAAEDIVQEVFTKAWDKKDTLAVHTSVEHYLRKATANASLNYLESRKRIVPFNERISSAQIDTGDRLSLKEFEKIVFHAIESLPPKCKTVFVLSRFENMKYQEIADHLDISVKTVENQMSKALRLLREDLKPYLTKEFVATLIAAGISLFPYLSLLLLLQLEF